METYREAINLQPRNFFAHNNLGVLYDKKGLYDAAIREFEDALAIEPVNAMALKNLETAKKNQAAIKAREAKILQAEREAQAKPNNPQASYNLARVYAFYGEKELAYVWLGKALKQGYRDIGYLRSDPLQQHPGGKRLSIVIETVYSLGPKNRANAAQFPGKLFLYDLPCGEAVSCWANMHAVGLKFICAFELWGK